MTSPPRIFQGQAALLSTDLIAFYRQVSRSMLTVVDVETTGSPAYKARVIEVSVLQASLETGIVQQQTALINPQVRVPYNITRVTGITQEMVNGGSAPETVWGACRPWLSTGILTAHNLEFDYSFLRSEYKRLGHPFSRPVREQLCTVLLSRILLADLPSRSLPNLVKHFAFDVGPSHRAEADTKACWFLAEKLLRQIQTESDEELTERFGEQWIRLKDAAQILGCRKQKAFTLLDKASIESRFSKRSNTPLYRRRDVERLYGAQANQADSATQP